MNPMSAVTSGLLNGLSIGSMLRRAALEDQQMKRMQEQDQRRAEQDSWRQQQQDLELAAHMAEQGIRPLAAEDTVRKMTGKRMVLDQGPGGIKAMPRLLEVPDDNRYVKFRGEEYVIPGETERAAKRDESARQALSRRIAEAKSMRDAMGVRSPAVSRLLGAPEDQAYMPNELDDATRGAFNMQQAEAARTRAENPRPPRLSKEVTRGYVQDGQLGDLHRFYGPEGDVVKEEFVPRGGAAAAKPPGAKASGKSPSRSQQADAFVERLMKDAQERGVKDMSHVIQAAENMDNYRDIPAAVKLAAVARLKQNSAAGIKVGSQSAARPDMPTATNSQGERVAWDGKAWQPVK